ncbi:hypothetical protein [Burkholderia cepacia]
MDLLSLLVGFALGAAAASLVAVCIVRFREAVAIIERDEHWFHD